MVNASICVNMWLVCVCCGCHSVNNTTKIEILKRCRASSASCVGSLPGLHSLVPSSFGCLLLSSLWVLYLFLFSFACLICSGSCQTVGALVFSLCVLFCRCLPFFVRALLFICFGSARVAVLYLFRFCRSSRSLSVSVLYLFRGSRQSHRGTFIIFLNHGFTRFQALKNIIL